MAPPLGAGMEPGRSAALKVRARLSERHPDVVRRHTLRLGSRIGILAATDLTVFLVARALLRSLVENQWLDTRFMDDVTLVGPLANPGRPGSTVFLLALFLGLAFTGSYTRHRGLNTVARLGAAIGIAITAATIPLAAVVGVRQAIAQTALVGAVTWIVLVLLRAVAERFLEHGWPRDRWAGPAIIIGPPDAGQSDAVLAVSRPGGDYRVAAHHVLFVSAARSEPQPVAAAVRRLIAEVDAEAVLICSPVPEQHLRALLEVVLETGCQLLYPVRAARIEDPRPRLVWHHDQPFFELGAPVLKMSAVAMKRTTDILLASVFLALAAPVGLVLAAGIKLDSRGPIFFRQPRAGRGGRRFDMLKFRTMRVGADEEKTLLAHLNPSGDMRLFKIPADPRVTKFGWFLRRWSLDELPQLWNVLRGDMSLVGPRPFFESDFAAYEDHHFRRLDTKPGITGLWQVSGRSEVVNFEEVVFLDRQYIEQWSLWLDVSILFRTISAVMRRTGAY